MHTRFIRWTLLGVLWALVTTTAAAQEIQSLLVRVRAVGKEGAGNVEAAKAWKELVTKSPGVLPEVLIGMDEASPIATNWLRAAVEAIQDKASQRGQKIPAAQMEAFLLDTRHSGQARRLAYECLVRVDPKTSDRLLPKMLDDPSAEMQRDAVAVKLKYGAEAAFTLKTKRTDYYQDLLRHARDRDQVDAICDQLKEDGVDIDKTAHYGFVTRWLLAGPFDNTKGVGFQNVYPPENGVDVKAAYQGKAGAMVHWQEQTVKVAAKELGVIDLNEAIGKLKGAVVYGYSALTSTTERPIELRAGSNNAVRIWLNGKEVYFREEYHHGMEMDQHVGKGVLKAGRNEILIKVCQNEQTDAWAQLWSFQLRVCDALGAAVPVVNVTEKLK